VSAAAPAVSYQKDALLAATFVRGSNNEIFAVGAMVSSCSGMENARCHPSRHRFEKPKPATLSRCAAWLCLFQPDGRWLLIIPPTLASAADGEAPARRAYTGSTARRADAGHELCKIQIWRWSMQNRTYEARARLGNSAASRFPHQFAWSNESDRLVIINARGTNEAECAFFQAEGTLPRTRR
jgi:hypothetical protein